MTRNLAILLTIVALSACASAPINFGKPDTSSRIGLIYLIDERPKHSHVGTTAFQNFETPNATDTDYRSKFADRCEDVVRQAGFHVESVEPSDLLTENRTDLFSYASSDVFFEAPIKSELNRIASASDLDFLILVYPVSGPAWVNSAAYIDGYGLYTECRFGNCSAKALNYVSARIYDVNNQSSLKSAGFRFFQNPDMPDSMAFEDPKAIDPAMIDEAAAMALDSFMVIYENMLRASEFIQ